MSKKRLFTLYYNSGISEKQIKLLITINETKNICTQNIIKLHTFLPQDVFLKKQEWAEEAIRQNQ